MRLPKLIREGHRWLSIVFTLAVVTNMAALALDKQATWVGLLALFPLILLMVSGLFMFALPYARRRHGSGSHHSMED